MSPCPSGHYEPLYRSTAATRPALRLTVFSAAKKALPILPLFGYYMPSSEVGVGLEELSKCTPRTDASEERAAKTAVLQDMAMPGVLGS